MSAWSKKASFCRFLDQTVNNGDYDILDQVFHPNFLGAVPELDSPIEGPSGVAKWAQMLREGFPDINTLIEGGWLIAENDAHHVGKGVVAERVAAYVVLRGTHTGSYAGLEASGRWVTWSQVHLLRFESGLIIEDTVVTDRLSLLQQIGAATITESIAGPRVPAELI